MEALGAVATIAGLAQTAFAISQTIANLVQAYKDSPSGIRDLGNDTTALGEVLLKIDSKRQKSSSKTPFSHYLEEQSFKTAIDGCRRDLDRLNVIISKLTSSSSSATWLRIRNTVKWIYLEEHIDSAKKSLEAHKSFLNIVLTFSIEENTQAIPEIKKDSREILQLVQVVATRIGELEYRNKATYKQAEETLAEPLPVLDEISTQTSEHAAHDSSLSLKTEVNTEVEAKLAETSPSPDLGIVGSRPEGQEAISLPDPSQLELNDRLAEVVLGGDSQGIVFTQERQDVASSTEPLPPAVSSSQQPLPQLKHVDSFKGDNHDQQIEPFPRVARKEDNRATEMTHHSVPHEVSKVTESTIENEANKLPHPRPLPRIQTPELVKALGTAAKGGFIDAIQLLLETGVDIDAYDSGSTALYRAIWWEKSQAVEVLLNHGANPNLQHKDGTSPLLEAARKNMIKTIRRLLEKGADIKEPGLLFKAFPQAEVETFQCLIDAGADLHPLYEGRPVLNQAVFWEKPAIVAVLLEAGMDPTVQGKVDLSPLVLAAQKGNPESIRHLLKHGQRRA